VITHRAHRRLLAERDIDGGAQCSALFTVGQALNSRVERAAEIADVRLRRDVTNRAGGRTRAEDRALRTAQHFDAIEIVEIEIRREQRDRNRRLV
jgi:hypothetical protein